MTINWKTLLFILLISYGAYHHWQGRPTYHGPGITAPDTPVQAPVRGTDKTPYSINGYTVEPLQTFHIEARVLSRSNYTFGRESDLSPVDLVLGWGPMSDEAVLKSIHISQGNRFYFWSVETFPIPRRDIEIHSANMHMIPTDRATERILNDVRAGQIVTIEGFLVEARHPDGWHWKSSLTREDTGGGACEIILIKSIRVSDHTAAKTA